MSAQEEAAADPEASRAADGCTAEAPRKVLGDFEAKTTKGCAEDWRCGSASAAQRARRWAKFFHFLSGVVVALRAEGGEAGAGYRDRASERRKQRDAVYIQVAEELNELKERSVEESKYLVNALCLASLSRRSNFARGRRCAPPYVRPLVKRLDWLCAGRRRRAHAPRQGSGSGLVGESSRGTQQATTAKTTADAGGGPTGACRGCLQKARARGRARRRNAAGLFHAVQQTASPRTTLQPVAGGARDASANGQPRKDCLPCVARRFAGLRAKKSSGGRGASLRAWRSLLSGTLAACKCGSGEFFARILVVLLSSLRRKERRLFQLRTSRRAEKRAGRGRQSHSGEHALCWEDGACADSKQNS